MIISYSRTSSNYTTWFKDSSRSLADGFAERDGTPRNAVRRVRVEVSGNVAASHVQVVCILRDAATQRYLERTELDATTVPSRLSVVHLLVDAVDVYAEARDRADVVE